MPLNIINMKITSKIYLIKIRKWEGFLCLTYKYTLFQHINSWSFIISFQLNRIMHKRETCGEYQSKLIEYLNDVTLLERDLANVWFWKWSVYKRTFADVFLINLLVIFLVMMTTIISVASKNLGRDAISRTFATASPNIRRSGKCVANHITKIHYFLCHIGFFWLFERENISIFVYRMVFYW